jgi:hypothetical protein
LNSNSVHKIDPSEVWKIPEGYVPFRDALAQSNWVQLVCCPVMTGYRLHRLMIHWMNNTFFLTHIIIWVWRRVLRNRLFRVPNIFE